MKKAIISAVSLFVGGVACAIALEHVAKEYIFVGLVLMVCGIGVGGFHAIPPHKMLLLEGPYYLVLGLALQSMAKEEYPRLLWIPHVMIGVGVYLTVRFAVLKCRKNQTIEKHVVLQEQQQQGEEAQAAVYATCEMCGRTLLVEEIRVRNGCRCCAACAEKFDVAQLPAMQQIKALFADASETDFDRVRRKDPYVVLWFLPTDLPLCYADRLCLFTSEKEARAAVMKRIHTPNLRDAITFRTLEKSALPFFWDECRSVGLERAVVDGHVLVPLSKLPRYTAHGEAVPSLAPLCNGMVLLQQTAFCDRCDQQTQTDSYKVLSLKKHLGGLLAKSVLWGGQTVETEKGMFAAMFTDAYAARGELDARMSCADAVTALRRVYEDPSVTGVVINPKRENWVIPKSEWETVFAGGMSFETK